MIIELTLIVLLLIVVLYNIQRSNDFWKRIYAIPGPKMTPIIGYTDLVGKSREEVFNYGIDRLIKYKPISKIWILNKAIVEVTKPEDVELVISGMKHITKGNVYRYLHQWLGTGLLTSTGSKWQYRRKIITPAFHFTILQDFVDIFNRETNALIQVLRKTGGEPIDVFKPIIEFALNSVGETSLGVRMNEQPDLPEYKDALHLFIELTSQRLLRPWLRPDFTYSFSSLAEKTNRTVKILHNFSNSIIQQRKKQFEENNSTYSIKKRKALLDLLLTARKNEGAEIDDEGIREEVDTFMFEGHDTTSLAIGYLLFSLASESKWQEEVYTEIQSILENSVVLPDIKQLGEMKLMERVIKEGLRLYPSVPFIWRVAREDIRSSTGYVIPKGASINIPIFYLHRSPDLWEDPLKFNPDRFLPDNISRRHPFSYIPFSAGPRNCIGQRFAMLEIKAALCGIIRNFIIEPVDKAENIKFKSDFVLRSSDSLRVRFVPRTS